MADASGQEQYGDYSIIFAWIAVLNIIFTYGFETAFFRFSNKDGIKKQTLYDTAFGSIIISTVIFCSMIWLFRAPITHFFKLGDHIDYITGCMWILGLDTLAAIPFARLRQEERPRKYAFIKVFGIVVNIVFIIVMMVYARKWVDAHPGSFFSTWYQKQNRLGFVIYGNVLENLVVIIALAKEIKAFHFRIDKRLWKQMILYSSPMVIIGLAGMINDVMDRQFLSWLLPFDIADNKRLVAIYSANYRLAIFITIFIQAFKMAAEPFFFNQSREKAAPVLYARIMKWLVITLCVAFLFTTLYLDIIKYIIDESYRSGLGVVPILVLANVFLGIYYNLSIWYKLSDKMHIGMLITLFGAVVTFIGNYFFIPKWGYYASAWTTLICYVSMVIVTYLVGQRYFPVPYPVKKITAYLVCALLLFFIQWFVGYLTANLGEYLQIAIRMVTGSVLMGLFLILVLAVERKELKGMPLIGKFIRK